MRSPDISFLSWYSGCPIPGFLRLTCIMGTCPWFIFLVQFCLVLMHSISSLDFRWTNNEFVQKTLNTFVKCKDCRKCQFWPEDIFPIFILRCMFYLNNDIFHEMLRKSEKYSPLTVWIPKFSIIINKNIYEGSLKYEIISVKRIIIWRGKYGTGYLYTTLKLSSGKV